MMNKYRTPRLEEFVKGFVYEKYSEGYDFTSIEDFCGWCKYIFEVKDTGICIDLYDIKLELSKGNIRVNDV